MTMHHSPRYACARATRFGELRSLLHQPASPERWRACCALLEACDPERAQELVPYARGHLRRGAQASHEAPPRWTRALLEGAPSPWFGVADALTLHSAHTLSEAACQALAAREELRSLRHLTIARPRQLEVAGLRALLASPHLARLESLTLLGVEGASTTQQAIAAPLARLPLRQLTWRAGHVDAQAAATLLDNPFRARLHALDLSDNLLSEGVAAALGALPLPQLRALSLARVGLRLADLKSLRGALDAPRLNALDVSGNTLDARGLQTLLDAPWRAQLCALGLSWSSAQSAMALTRIDGLDALSCLDLSWNALDDDAISALMHAPWLGRLRELALHYNRIGDAGARHVARRAGRAHHLRTLDLRYNRISDAGERMLLSARWASRLERLALDENVAPRHHAQRAANP